MVHMDAKISRRINNVSKRKLNLNFITFRSGEKIIAHGHSSGPIDDDTLILESYFRPTLYGKPFVFRTYVIFSNEVGQSTFKC